MKPFLGHYYSRFETLNKLLFFLTIMCALEAGSALNADAQHGHGSGGGMRGSRGGGGMSFSHGHSMGMSSHNSGIGRFPRGAGNERWSPAFHRSFHGSNFAFHGDRYYRYNRGRYIGYYPLGFRISVLPAGYFQFHIGPNPFFYYGGVYYSYRDSDATYEVVKPPLGALIETLPEGCDKLIIDGETFYVLGGVQYKPVLVDGVVWYKVIKAN